MGGGASPPERGALAQAEHRLQRAEAQLRAAEEDATVPPAHFFQPLKRARDRC